MTLVVAEVEGGRITAVCDSLSYYENDPATTRQAYSNARPKLLILRDDLLVGVAGDDFWNTLETLASMRDLSANDIVEQARSLTKTDPFGRRREILIGALKPSRLWQVKNGNVVAAHETAHARAWLGDREAFNRFCGLETPSREAGLRLQAPMQSLAHLGGNSVVGGITLRVDTCDHGFGYQATPVTMFEPADDATFSYDGDCLRIKASFSIAPMSIAVLTGQDPTRGALAIHFCGAKFGYLYPHGSPWIQERLTADSCTQLLRLAAERGQTLTAHSGCPAAMKA